MTVAFGTVVPSARLLVYHYTREDIMFAPSVCCGLSFSPPIAVLQGELDLVAT